MARIGILISFVVALVVGGCGASAVGMRPAHPPASYESDDGMATLVFVRRSRAAKAVTFFVVDQRGRFVASLRDRMHAIIHVPPGHRRYFLIVSGENTDAVDVDVEAGRTYVVETRLGFGWVKSKVVVRAVRRGTERFGEIGALVQATPPFIRDPDTSAGRLWADQHQPNILARIERTNLRWAEEDERFRGARTLTREDGYLPRERGW